MASIGVTMHLQQTKVRSRTSGGPQYYFHNVPEPVKEFLRNRGACSVVLQTPYGIAKSGFTAVGKDHKLSPEGEVITGSVGHDRIQQATGEKSIGEAIRYWYDLKADRDFERIEVEAEIHPEGHFILVPIAVRMREAKRMQSLEKCYAPLSFHHDHQSRLWRNQIEMIRKQSPERIDWVSSQISQVVSENCNPDARHILEADLLRTAGALSLLGLELSAYLGSGYDCQHSRFQFSSFPIYPCPVEIKKKSVGFNYQITRYTKLPRAVVLCIEHNIVNPPSHIDFIELPTLAEYLSS